MPRDNNGNYTLPAGNPVVAGTTIDTSWANPTMQDIANELTDSLSRTGEGGMLVPMLFADGTVGQPGISWINQPNTGIYRADNDDMRVSVNGVDISRSIIGSFELWDGAAWLNSTALTGQVADGGIPQQTNTIAGDVDFNTLIEPGFYKSDVSVTGPNSPPAAAGGLLVQLVAGTALSQTYFAASSGRIYNRSSDNALAWSDWLQLATTAALGSYLQLAGGVMTGDITYQNGNSANTISDNANFSNWGKSAANSTSNADTVTRSGQFQTTSGTTGLPLATSGTLLHMAWSNTSAASQIFMNVSSAANRMWFRGKSSSTWGPWTEQSARDTGGPGWSLNTDTNTLTQWGTTPIVGASVTELVTFPKIFADTNYSLVSQRNSLADDGGGTGQAKPNPGQCQIFNGTGVASTFSWQAIGTPA